MKLCHLCQKNEATKTNSHILPKYFGTSMLTLKSEPNKRRVYDLSDYDLDKSITPAQDTPKEDYILCPICEEKFSKIEGKFSREFYRKVKDPKYASDFQEVPGQLTVKIGKKVDYQNFKKLCYSLFWRASISSANCFQDLKLDEDISEKLRQILNDEIPFEDFPITVVTTDGAHEETANPYYGASLDDYDFIWSNEYIFFFDPNAKSNLALFKALKPFRGSANVLVCPVDQWENMRSVFWNLSAQKMKERLNKK